MNDVCVWYDDGDYLVTWVDVFGNEIELITCEDQDTALEAASELVMNMEATE